MEKITKSKTRLILKYIDNELISEERQKFEAELLTNPALMKEYELNLRLKNSLKARFKSEQAETDQFIDQADQFAEKAIDDYVKKKDAGKEIRDFILSAREESSPDEKLAMAEKEFDEKNLGNLADEWIKDLENKKENVMAVEIRDFVESVMKEEAEKEKEQKKKQYEGKVLSLHKQTYNRKWLYVAASIAAVLVISFFVLRYFTIHGEDKDLFAQYYTPYHFATEQNRSGDSIIEMNLETAANLYNQSSYTRASEIINEVLKKDSENVKAHFLSGLILMEKKNFTVASAEFEHIISDFDTYRIESKWYLALCYLKLDKSAEAKGLFTELSASGNYYQKRAGEILKDLEKFNSRKK